MVTFNRHYARLVAKVLKKSAIYFLLFILAFIVSEPAYYYIHEYGHMNVAKEYEWNYFINYTNHISYITDSRGIPYAAPTSIIAEGAANATNEQLFKFYIKPYVLSFTIPVLMLFLMTLVPAKRKNQYVEIFFAFLALWLLINASASVYVFREGSDMWKIAHLFS